MDFKQSLSENIIFMVKWPMKPENAPENAKEIIFEITQIGAIARVTAIDPITGTEVVIQGPASAGDMVLKQNAARKLMFVLAKQKDGKR